MRTVPDYRDSRDCLGGLLRDHTTTPGGDHRCAIGNLFKSIMAGETQDGHILIGHQAAGGIPSRAN